MYYVHTPIHLFKKPFHPQLDGLFMHFGINLSRFSVGMSQHF